MRLDIGKTLDILKGRGIEVALNVGEHSCCELNSNCPMAIKLRKMIADMGITTEELEQSRIEEAVVPPLVNTQGLSEGVSAALNVSIFGKTVSVDMADIVSSELKVSLKKRLDSLQHMESDVRELGTELHRVYTREIQETRRGKILPMLTFTPEYLLLTGIQIVGGKDRQDTPLYLIYVPFKYNPKLIYRDGTTKVLNPDDVEKIKNEHLFLKYTISKEYKVINIMIVHPDDSKFSHYHSTGHGSDCWGNVQVMRIWDGTLESIGTNAKLLEKSLGIVNYNSLASREPSYMPGAVELLDRATVLGREGEITATRRVPIPAPRQIIPDEEITVEPNIITDNRTDTNIVTIDTRTQRWGRRALVE